METISTISTAAEAQNTCPFLLRTFVKINAFHPLALFEDNRFPTEDELCIYTWKDATLKDLANYLRSLPPSALSLTLRHPAARYVFKVAFPDVTSRGRMTSKELGSVTGKDLVKNPQVSHSATQEDAAMELDGPSVGQKDLERHIDPERTLDELRVVAGDFLLVAVHLPPKALGMSIAGAAGGAQGLLSGPSRGGPNRSGPSVVAAPLGRGAAPRAVTDLGWGRGRGADATQSGHWRGGPRGGAVGTVPGRVAPSRSEERVRERRPSPIGRDRDRRPSPTGRDRDHIADRRRGGTRSRSNSRSRSRSPAGLKHD